MSRHYIDAVVANYLAVIENMTKGLAILCKAKPVLQEKYFEAELKLQLADRKEEWRDAVIENYSKDRQMKRMEIGGALAGHIATARLAFASAEVSDEWARLSALKFDPRLGEHCVMDDHTRADAPIIAEDTPCTIFFLRPKPTLGIYIVNGPNVLMLARDRDGDLRLSHIGPAWSSAHAYAIGALLHGRVERESISTNDRRAISKAKLAPRRDFYIASAYKYSPKPRQEPQGGTHASPVAHTRSAHLVCRVKMDVTPENAQELMQRGYVVMDGADVPEDVRQRMRRYNEVPVPGTLVAYLWTERSGSTVNPDGPKARKVQMVAAK